MTEPRLKKEMGKTADKIKAWQEREKPPGKEVRQCCGGKNIGKKTKYLRLGYTKNPRVKKSGKEILGAEAIAPLFKSSTSATIYCNSDCEEGLCCGGMNTQIITPEALLGESRKDECVSCEDSKTCLKEFGVICGTGETV